MKDEEEAERKKQAEKGPQTYDHVSKMFKEEQKQNNIQLQIENSTPLHMLKWVCQ